LRIAPDRRARLGHRRRLRRGSCVDLFGELDGGADADRGFVEADALGTRVDVDLVEPRPGKIGLDEALAGTGITQPDAELRGLGGSAQRSDRACARLRVDAD